MAAQRLNKKRDLSSLKLLYDLTSKIIKEEPDNDP